MQDKEKNHVIAGIFCLFSDHLNCARNWGFYLEAEEFKGEPELKNKIIAIWISSLIDPISKEEKWLELHLSKARALNLCHLERYTEQARYFFQTMKDLLSSFTREEQILITDFRNQLVHGFLGGRHEKKRKIRFVSDGEFVEDDIPRHEYEEIIVTALGESSWDDLLSDFRLRFVKERGVYWQILRELQHNREAIYEAMKSGQEYEFQSIPL